MKKRKRLFFRSFLLSFVLISCLIMGIYGVGEAYKNTRRIGFGEYRKAVSVEKGTLQILDYEWDFTEWIS